jgi:hypothetical protein
MSQNNENDGLSIDFGDELSKNLTVHKNVKQEIIVTTSDKIRLVLMKAKESLAAQRDWWTPAGLLISFVTTLLTTDFKDSFGLTKDAWKAIFILMTIASGLWLAQTIYRLIKTWNEDDLDKIIKEIKLKE